MTLRTLVIRETGMPAPGELQWTTEQMIASGWQLVASERIHAQEMNLVFRKDAADEEPFLPLQPDL